MSKTSVYAHVFVAGVPLLPHSEAGEVAGRQSWISVGYIRPYLSAAVGMLINHRNDVPGICLYRADDRTMPIRRENADHSTPLD